MAQKEFVYLQGKAKWARLTVPDQYGHWSIVLYPNAESKAKIQDLISRGLKNNLKKDEDGEYMTFRRPTSKDIRGKVVGFAPPEVIQGDGVTPLREALVGNGSDVTVKVEVYGFKRFPGVAARLQAVRVDTLVPYSGDRDFTDDQKDLVKGLPEQPEQKEELF